MGLIHPEMPRGNCLYSCNVGIAGNLPSGPSPRGNRKGRRPIRRKKSRQTLLKTDAAHSETQPWNRPQEMPKGVEKENGVLINSSKGKKKGDLGNTILRKSLEGALT